MFGRKNCGAILGAMAEPSLRAKAAGPLVVAITNRKVYRLKTLELHNVTVSNVEKDDLECALHMTM